MRKGRIIKATDPQGRELVHSGILNVEIKEQRYRSARNGGKYGADTVRLFMMFASCGNDIRMARIRR